jgi:hypothetical protein
MSVVLPLPYIRPFASKCFAVGVLQVHGSGFRIGSLLEPKSPPTSAASQWGVSLAPNAILCLKHPKGKNPHPARGTLADNPTHSLGRKQGQMVSSQNGLLARN